MTPARLVAVLILLFAGMGGGFAGTAKRAEAAATGQHVKIANPAKPPRKMLMSTDARAAQAPAGQRLGTRLVAGGKRWFGSVIERQIEQTKQRIIASLAQEPDDFDARDALWQRLHRLQSWRDRLA